MQLPFFGHSPWDRFRRAKEVLSAMIYAEIENRRRSGTSGADILSLMLAARHEDGSAMTDEELRDELLTLLFAGHETTGIALAWSIYWLLRHPDCMNRLLAEIDALGNNPEPEQIGRLPYLDAVVSETLRLHPIVPDVPRKLTRPFEIGGYVLPEGTGVAVATAMIHTRPDLYPDPERFKPERFLERRYSPFEFTPFGGGARRCLGAAFATYEMKIVLATLLSHHRLVLTEKADVRPGRRNVVLGPATGVHVKLIGPRSARPAVTQAVTN
jgi:cytochrome P450